MPPADLTESVIRDWCIASIERIVDNPAIPVGPDMTFAEMGLDSASSAYFIVELEDWLGIELDPELVVEHPTIAAVARHLMSRHGNTGDAAPG